MDKSITELGEHIVTHCEPLYLSKALMLDGHSAEKANGTITYIKYKGKIYGVTCAHVLFSQNLGTQNERVLSVFGMNRVHYQFGAITRNGYLSNFRALRKSPDDVIPPDIAVTRLDEPFPSIHMMSKGKKAIDLDKWTQPYWNDINICVACGFPTEHKTQTDTIVSAGLVQVFAEPAGPLSPDRESFLLASSLDNECEVYLSGMSGGPVYVEGEREGAIDLIGIVYEGSPGSSKDWEHRHEGAFMTKKDIQVKAYTITPGIFENWLKIVGYL